MYNNMTSRLENKIKKQYNLPPAAVAGFARKLSDCCDELKQNLTEWLDEKPLSDIKIRDKYTINMVLNLHGNNDFISAFTALDAYAKNPTAEIRIWQGIK